MRKLFAAAQHVKTVCKLVYLWETVSEIQAIKEHVNTIIVLPRALACPWIQL